ncbi:MAG: N-acetyltransferase [Rhodanobacter sp.]|nr:MAG: N-acetyltransferase [Rhodanobacter sp.]TAM13214.1 MAG: N-acetyltransferase [Rhodanobacter sp.]TAM35366.1 MAG: N-acetyltransferase [Rhodanobacter sp.]
MSAPGAPVPLLETARLRLRAHIPEDLPAADAMWSAPDTVRHIGGRVFSREENWRRLLQYRGLWALLGYGYWAVEERAGGCYVGDVGFGDFARAIEPSLSGMLEAGWVLAPAMRGKGYATEAVNAALAWAGGNQPGRRIVAVISPANQASIHVAEKTGFRRWRSTTYLDAPALVYARGEG